MSQPESAAATPGDIVANPTLSRWLRVDRAETLSVFCDKIELGQGIEVALLQLACDELGVEPRQVRLVCGSTVDSPNQGYTFGSLSVEFGGAALRWACAHAYSLYCAQAARHLNVAVETLSVSQGVFGSPGSPRRVSYWELAEDVDLGVDIRGEPRRRREPSRRWVGQSLARPDLPAKLSGAAYVHDLALPGLVHARMLRGPHPTSRLLDVPLDALRALDGVSDLVHSGQFLALVGPDEGRLVSALGQARKLLQWQSPVDLVEQRETAELLQAMACETEVVHRTGQAHSGLIQHESLYSRPYLAHAAIGPSCAVADPRNGRLIVWSHTQGSHPLRGQIAQALGRPADSVDVIHVPGAGCYGHNGADDVAFDAAFIAERIAQPVRVQWMREDEMISSPCGSAMAVHIAGSVDGSGRICRWDMEIWSHTHVKRPGFGAGINLLGAWQVDPPMPEPKAYDMPLPAGGGHRNAIAYYALPHQQVTYHFIESSPVRVSALRSLGAYANTFAIESFFDELAALAGVDPLEFRLRHLDDARARAVLESAARMASWSQRQEAGSGAGLGIGFGRYKNRAAYCAVVALVRVEEKVHVERVWAVVDAGAVVNPDGLVNQIEGGIVQSLSWTLKEMLSWDASGITCDGWERYPILAFDEVPSIEVTVIGPQDAPSLGIGEVAAGPTAAALGNAVAHALGLRARHLPLTPDRLERLVQQADD